MDDMSQTNSEMIVNLIEIYTMLQRIRKDEKGENPTLDYEIRRYEVTLHSVGINTEDLKL